MKYENVNFLIHGIKIDEKAPLRRYVEAGLSPPFGFALATSMGSQAGLKTEPLQSRLRCPFKNKIY